MVWASVRWRDALAVGALLTGAILSARAFEGPFFVSGIRVNSPLTLETLFTVLAGVLFFSTVRAKDAGGAAPGPALILHCATALALVTLAYSPNLRDPFLSDDYVHVAHASLDTKLILPTFYTPGGDGSFRPLTYAWYGLIHVVFGANPFAWHATTLAVHLANCALLYWLVSMLWPGRTILPFAAATLWGLHGAQPEAVVWCACNADLLACFFTLAAACTVFHPSPRARTFRVVLSLLMVAAAVLFKESAYDAPIVLAMLAIASGRSREWPVRASALGSLLVCAALFAYRWSLFHGPGGYRDPATGRPAVLSLHVLSAAKVLGLRLWTLLLFPINWDVPLSALTAVAVLAGCTAVVWLLWRSGGVARPVAVPLLAATALAIMPAIHLASIGQSDQGSRVLYLPSLAFFVLAAHAVASLRKMRNVTLVLSVLVISSIALLEHNLRVWHNVARAADDVCAAAAAAGTTAQPRSLPDSVTGVFFLGNGFAECVEMKRHKQ